MKEFIPSKEQRDYFNKVGFEFTDFQKAAIIWTVSNYTWEERLSSLEQLSSNTQNNELKKQIAERIEYEKKAMEVFKENSEKKSIYIIEYYHEQLGHINEGYFFNFDDALKFSRELIEKEISDDENIGSVCIDKYEVSIAKQQIDVDRYTNSSYSGRVELDMSGEIESLWSNEYKDEYELKKGRFEGCFYTFPLSPEFQAGTIVQSVCTKDIYIISLPYNEWEECCNGIWTEKKDELDCFDVAITVYMLTDNGNWSHEHLNPLYLTTDINWGDKDSDYKEVINKMSEYLGGNKSAESEVLRLSRKHADRDFKNKVYSAQKLSDIMF